TWHEWEGVMDPGSVTIPAFNFLDIRPPRAVNPKARYSYVINRNLLRFPQTQFERILKNIARDQQYVDNLTDAVTNYLRSAPLDLSQIVGGFLDDRTKYEALLSQQQSSQEDHFVAFRNLYRQLKGTQSEPVYLLRPSATVWDLYLVTTLLKLFGRDVFGRDVDDEFARRVSLGIRIAGAIFTMKGASRRDEVDLRTFGIASIHIGNDLVDTSLVRKHRKIPDEGPMPDTAR